VVDARIEKNLLGTPFQPDLDFNNWYVIEVQKVDPSKIRHVGP
jgi:hypothetical protein